MANQFSRGLTADQINDYRRDGFVHPVRVASLAQAAAWRAELEAMEAEWLDAGLPQPLNTYKRVNSHVVMPFADRIGRHPAILDAVESILGPDVMIYAVEFFIKEACTTHVVSMHQDLTYWGLGATEGLTTAWVALNPATTASGCMDLVRGSHKNPILPHEDTFDQNNLLSRGQEVKVDVRPQDRTAIVLEPGEMSLHHGLTIHGSGPNTSRDRRIGCAIRYVRPDVAQEVGEVDYAVLVRGKDRFGNFRPVPQPTALFAPESLDVYEQIRSSQAKIMMRGAKGANAMYAKG